MIRTEIVHAIAIDVCGIGAALILAVTAISMESRFDGIAQQAKCVTPEQVYKPSADCRQVRVR